MALEVVSSAVLRTAVPSLWKLLLYEWGLDKAAKDGLSSLEAELSSMQAFFEEVSCMQPDQLDRPLKQWAGEVRELSYAIEIRLHSFMARIESTSPRKKGTLLSALRKLKINHKIASYVKEIMIKVKEVSERGARYSHNLSKSSCTKKVDPRILALYYTKDSDLVGLAGATDELTKMLSKGDHVSIVGMGGLGKTTLARAVSDKMKDEFEIRTFVPLGQSTDAKNVLKNILLELGTEINGDALDERQLIDKLRNSLVGKKRCLFVIDDIWDKETWALINCAFEGNANCKIITTTRKLKVAEAVGGVYMMKPLSDANSKELLHTKIFGAEAESHDTEFARLSDKFLSKCSGVPIAIITIASLLRKKLREEWSKVYDSIGFGEHEEEDVVKDIRTILSFSYYDLPYHLQRCFLYLSLFPEDHWIEKNMLIWRWVAEGLVSSRNEQRVGLFELGETYFNELIDRSMIQWAVSPRDLGQGGCRIHDMMLDIIRDLSTSSDKENFSTVLNGKQESTSPKHIHRLAIHKTNVGQIQNTNLEVGEVLSFYANTCPGSAFPPLSSFALVRVIDLEDCDLSVGDCKLKHLGKLKYMEYIGLLGTRVTELPKQIGHLKFLQTLDVTRTDIKELPPFVGELTKLRCLRAGEGTRMMGRVGKLTSLEELWLHSADKSPDLAVELRKLSELRVLVIHFDEMDEGMQEALVESLNELKKLQVLQVWSDAEEKVRLGCWEGSVPSRQFRQLLLFGFILRRLTPWIHPSCVPKLSNLLLEVKVLKVQDLEILGQMPSLRSLYLHSEEDMYRLSYTANKNEFKVLEYLNTNIELVCGEGALPRIQELEVAGIKVGTDVGLRGNMPLLEKARYHIDCFGCDLVEIDKAETALKQAREDHPKRPKLNIERFNDLNGGLEIELQLSELRRQLVGQGGQDQQANASSSGGNSAQAGILNIVSESLARILPTIRKPPTLTVADATITSEFAGVVRPNGEGQVLLTTTPRWAPRHESTKGEIQVSTESWLTALSSEAAAISAITLAAQTRMDPAVIINIYEQLAYNPEFIAATNNVEWGANGYLSASHISTTLPLIMRETISQEEQKVGGPGTSAAEGLRDKSFEFEVLDSFERVITDDAELASIESMITDNAVPGITVNDVVAKARELTKKSLQNPEIVACLKSLQDAGASGPSASDMLKLDKVMADWMSNMDQETHGPGRSQGAQANLAGKHPAENSGAGAGPKPTPKGLRDKSFEFKVLDSFERVITDDALLASIDSELADDNALPGITAKDVAADSRKFMKKALQNPEVVACLKSLQNAGGSGPSPSAMFKLRMVMMAELMRYMDQETDGPGRSQGAQANLAGKHPAENSGASVGLEPTPKVDADRVHSWLNSPHGAAFVSVEAAQLGMDPVVFERIWKKCWLNPENPEMLDAMHRAMQNDDGSEFDRLHAQLLEQEIENYFVKQCMDGPSSTPGYAGCVRDDACSTSAPPPESGGQDGENASRMLRQVLPAVEQALAAGASSGQPSAAQVDAHSELNRGGPADASGKLFGLSSDPALVAQSDMMDAITSSVAPSRLDGENSSTIFNLNELLATLEKETNDGASSGQPSAAQPEVQRRAGRGQWRRKVRNHPRVP